MTESIKFGPEWLRNSVANVSSSNPTSMAPTTDSITCRPVLSDHRYGREEMLSLCDKSTRLPDVLTRFRRLYVTEWQTPLALQPNTDDERSLGVSTTWGPHIRPLMPSGIMGRGGPGMIRGCSIERGRGRGRGLYHGNAGYARSTSLYDEEGRRTNLWLDRNGTDTTEWSGSAVSPRKEYSRGASSMENWRKGTRDESGGTGNEVDWRSNGTATAKEKWGKLKVFDVLNEFTLFFNQFQHEAQAGEMVTLLVIHRTGSSSSNPHLRLVVSIHCHLIRLRLKHQRFTKSLGTKIIFRSGQPNHLIMVGHSIQVVLFTTMIVIQLDRMIRKRKRIKRSLRLRKKNPQLSKRFLRRSRHNS